MKKISLLQTVACAMGIVGGLTINALAADAPSTPAPAAPAPAAATAPAPSGPNNVPADYKGKPYTGTPQTLPGEIKAITYDIGGADVAFGYKGTAKKTQYRTTPDSIGIDGFREGHVSTDGKPEAPEQVYVGWTQPGEWLKYTVQVNETATYIIGAKVSAGAKGAHLTFSFSPTITTEPLEIPTTAGFQPGKEVYHVWEKLDKMAEIKLPAGTYVMTVKLGDVAGMNFESFSLTKKP